MAEGKNSFVLYTEYIEIFEELSDKDAGQLIKHLFRYVNDKNPETENPLAKLAFIPIKQQLKRDLKKYESICERNAKNGAKGGRPPKPKKPSGLSGKNEKPKKADNDNEDDNDTDNENDIRIDEEVLYNVDKLFDLYCQNSQLIKAVLENNNFKTEKELKDRLEQFNKFLKERGQNMKKWSDYTSHFLNWHKKKPKQVSSKPTENLNVI